MSKEYKISDTIIYDGIRLKVVEDLKRNCGELPKSYYNLSRTSWSGGGYYCKEVEKKGVRIYGMN